MVTLDIIDSDCWVVVGDPGSTNFSIIHVEKGSRFKASDKIVKPFSNEDDAIKFIRKYIPYYAKRKESTMDTE